MTAASAPARTAPPAATWRHRSSYGRLFRVELRRNAMPWVLPLIAVLFWFDSYRTSGALPPLWVQRTFYAFGQGHTLIDFGPFVAGVAAWMGSRDGRRGMTDLITATARPRWGVRAATWAATACWAVGAYLVFTAVLLAVMASKIPWGGPPLWPAAVGATGVAAFSAAGFAAGAWFPGRFTAPVAAFGAFLVLLTSTRTGFHYTSGWALILPTNSNSSYGNDVGVFSPSLPDLPIARAILLSGVTLAALGLIGLRDRDGGTWLRRGAALLTLAGVAAAGTAIGLAGTARPGRYGVIIPALHDAASDRPIQYAPDCGRAVIPVCLHPAYQADLPIVEAGIGSVLRQITGLPGAPVKAVQVASTYTEIGQSSIEDHAAITGSPPALTLSLNAFGLPGTEGLRRADLVGQVRVQIVHAFIVAGAGGGTLAQQAVQAVLLRDAGIPFGAQPRAMKFSPFGSPLPAGQQHAILTAAARLAALSPGARHAWLAAHLGELRSGRLTLAQLP